jgi:hypothetical protein
VEWKSELPASDPGAVVIHRFSSQTTRKCSASVVSFSASGRLSSHTYPVT